MFSRRRIFTYYKFIVLCIAALAALKFEMALAYDNYDTQIYTEHNSQAIHQEHNG